MSLDHQTVDDVLRQTSATAAQAQPDGTHHSHWEEDMGPTDEVVVAVPKSSSTFSSSAVAASSASSNVSSLPSSSYAAPATSVPAATVTAASATSASATGDELTFSRSYHEHDMDIRQRVPEIDDQVLTDFLERRQMPAYLRMQVRVRVCTICLPPPFQEGWSTNVMLKPKCTHQRGNTSFHQLRGREAT